VDGRIGCCGFCAGEFAGKQFALFAEAFMDEALNRIEIAARFPAQRTDFGVAVTLH
jgi:hypothetical protein